MGKIPNMLRCGLATSLLQLLGGCNYVSSETIYSVWGDPAGRNYLGKRMKSYDEIRFPWSLIYFLNFFEYCFQRVAIKIFISLNITVFILNNVHKRLVFSTFTYYITKLFNEAIIQMLFIGIFSSLWFAYGTSE